MEFARPFGISAVPWIGRRPVAITGLGVSPVAAGAGMAMGPAPAAGMPVAITMAAVIMGAGGQQQGEEEQRGEAREGGVHGDRPAEWC